VVLKRVVVGHWIERKEPKNGQEKSQVIGEARKALYQGSGKKIRKGRNRGAMESNRAKTV